MTLHELEVRIAGGEIDALIAELGLGDAADQMLAIALRREQHALCAIPELTLSTLYRVGFGNVVLQPMLEAWEKEWVKQQRGPWLRALTPQHWGLESAMSRRYPDCAERSSSSPPRYQVTKSWQDRHLSILDQSTNRSWLIPYPNDDAITCVAVLDETNLIVGGWYCEDDGFVARVNLETQQIVWRTPQVYTISCLLVIAKEQLIAIDKSRAHLLQSEDGNVLNTFALPHGSYELSEDRESLVVGTGDMCRSFRIDLLTTMQHPSDRRAIGYADAEFSSAGEILVCGHMMFNARTGQPIAELDADLGGYLEGGPPERGRRVVTSGFIETHPGRGTKRWNRRGVLIHTCETYFCNWHELVFSDDGRHLALADRSSKRIELREVDSQDVKATSTAPALPGFEWVGNQTAVVYISKDGCVRMIAVDGSDQLISDQPHAQTLCISWDGNTLATMSGIKNFNVYSAEDWSLATATIWSLRGPPSRIGEVALSASLLNRYNIAEFLHGRHGFRIRGHQWRAEYRQGWCRILDENTGSIVAQVACDGPLHADPTGRRWASRTELLALDL